MNTDSAVTTRPPDLVLILTDQERAAPAYETEEIRAWRDEHLPGRRWFGDHGVDFTRHYVASLACVPSRPSLMTGHYPDLHGVTQTDGLAKRARDSRMRWLRPGEVPTMGDWLRAAGYDTHYVGKWHCSHADLEVDGRRVATNTGTGELIPEGVQAYLDADPLDPFGFGGWIGPEPHGPRWADSGTVRDPIFADRAVAFLEDRYARRRAGEAEARRPFLLVCSFVNPHDIVMWPAFARNDRLGPLPDHVPAVPPSPSDGEDLSTKPALQSAYRDGYYSGYGPPPLIRRTYRRNPDAYRRTYLRLHHDVDAPIERVRRAVTDGDDDAVMILTSDHGELLGSHGGLHQKWYQAYDEATRVPFRVVRTGATPSTPACLDEPTSHVDVVPTLLGFAGADVAALAEQLAVTHSEVHPLPGRDLSGVVAQGSERASPPSGPVYLITRDSVLDGDGNAGVMLALRGRTRVPPPLQIQVPAHAATNVEAVIVALDPGVDGLGHVWKLARTFDDPAGWDEPNVRHVSARTAAGPVYRTQPIPDQWELYDLTVDAAELTNLDDDPSLADVRRHLEAALERVRAERVPERNQAWPVAPRAADPPRPERPPPPARALRRVLQRVGLHPDAPGPAPVDLAGRRALVVATNHGSLDVGKPTGVFGSELTAPYYEFLDAGMQVDIASPNGGEIPFDPLSFKPVVRTAHDDRFLADDEAKAKVRESLAIGELDMADYDIVYFAGGWGAAWDLGTSETVAEQVSAAAGMGKVLGGVCHGPLGLLKATGPDGEPLVKGRRITAVTDKQVAELGITATPQHPETELRAAGAVFESRTHRLRDIFANHVVVDGDLVTGQNQNAGPEVAREMMRRVVAKGAGDREGHS